MDHSFFPPYADIITEEGGTITSVQEGDLVVLESGKTFIYQVTSVSAPGRYKAYSERVDTSAGGLVFDKINPIQLSEKSVQVTDPDDSNVTITNTEIKYSIKIDTLEEVN